MMKLVWAVIPLILIVSMIGIMSIQNVEARCLDPNTCESYNYAGAQDEYGNSVNELIQSMN